MLTDFDLRRPIRDPEVLERMRITCELFEAALEIERQSLRRRNPQATDEEIEAGVRAWLEKSSGAEHPEESFVRSRRFAE